jgi:5-hydroxyisourate hydrolase
LKHKKGTAAMGRLSTHVLDTVAGGPAAGVRIDLHRLEPSGQRHLVCVVTTNADGRSDAPLLAGAMMQAGSFELTFHVGDYFRALHPGMTAPGFLEQVPVRFQIMDPGGHYHVPLLVSPHAYSTYRGS